MEMLSQNIAELPKAMGESYKGMMPFFSVSEEERAKMFDWINGSVKKNIETTTSVINKQLETLTKLVEDASSNVTKLAEAMRAGTTA